MEFVWQKRSAGGHSRRGLRPRQGGEVLASIAVRELSAGKGFLFSDRGEFVAKGFEEPVRMFEVSWRG